MCKRVRVSVEESEGKFVVGTAGLKTVLDLSRKVARVAGVKGVEMWLQEHMLLPQDSIAVLNDDEALVARRGVARQDFSSSSSSSSTSDSSGSSDSSDSSDSSESSQSSSSVPPAPPAPAPPAQVVYSASKHQDVPVLRRDACRLYVGSLPPLQEPELRAHVVGVLAGHGLDPSALLELTHNAYKKFAFVEFNSPEVTTRALELLRNELINGRVVRWSRPHAYSLSKDATQKEAPKQPPQKQPQKQPQQHQAPSEECDAWAPCRSLEELQVGASVAFKTMTLDEETWSPSVSKEWSVGSVVDLEGDMVCLKLHAKAVVVLMKWTAMLDLRIKPQ